MTVSPCPSGVRLRAWGYVTKIFRLRPRGGADWHLLGILRHGLPGHDFTLAIEISREQLEELQHGMGQHNGLNIDWCQMSASWN
jgi:hypothetical protein